MEFIKGLGISRKELIDLMFIQESITIIKSRYMMNFGQSLYEGTLTINDEILSNSISDFISYAKNQKRQDTRNSKYLNESKQKAYTKNNYIFSGANI